jgi:large subunit ribosomal protein L6
MRTKMEEILEIPSGVDCSFANNMFSCKKGSVSLSRKIEVPNLLLKIEGQKIILSMVKGNKNSLKLIKSQSAHINNLFLGLDKKFIYKLEACNVHFPMTLKNESGYLVINNFLGEKTPRKAKILPNVEIELKAPKITLSSHDREAVGQTAANIEKATKIRNRDRRIFQDGIYITEKPGAKA